MTAEVTLRLTPIPQGRGHTRKQINSFDAVVHMQEIVPQAVLADSKMRLTLRAARPTSRHLALGICIQAMSAWSVKTRHDMLRPGIVGMRGSLVIQLRPCMT